MADDAEALRSAHRQPAQRLGPRSVRRLAPVESHLPERAEMLAVAGAAPVWPAPDEAQPRPLLLLPHAEPADVMALVPEGPAAALPLARRDA